MSKVTTASVFSTDRRKPPAEPNAHFWILVCGLIFLFSILALTFFRPPRVQCESIERQNRQNLGKLGSFWENKLHWRFGFLHNCIKRRLCGGIEMKINYVSNCNSLVRWAATSNSWWSNSRYSFTFHTSYELPILSIKLFDGMHAEWFGG